MNEKSFPRFYDYEWMYDFRFCIEFTQHMNKLNIRLQRANYFVSGIFDKITASESKFVLRANNSSSENVKALLTLRNTLKKFNFCNKTSTPLFEIYVGLRPKATYSQFHLALWLKRFWSNSKEG